MDSTFDLRTDSQKRQALTVLSQLIKASSRLRVESIVQNVTDLILKDRWMEIGNPYSSEKPLSLEDIGHMTREGVIIGSHSHDHFILHAAPSADDLEFWLKISEKLTERYANRSVSVAYKNGRSDMTRESLRRVKENGYVPSFSAVKEEICREADPFLLHASGCRMILHSSSSGLIAAFFGARNISAGQEV